MTERSNLAIPLMLMMEFFGSLRIARVLGLLAVLLTAGLGQHEHAAKADLTQAIAGECVTSEHAPGEPDAPGGIHCGFCHAVRAMLPAPESLSEPMMLASRQVPVESTRLADTLPSGVPSPPPRRRATA